MRIYSFLAKFMPKSRYLWQTYYYILMKLAENMLIGTLWDVLEDGV